MNDFITMSERIEMIKLSHEKRKAQKLVLEDVASDVEEQDEVGVTEEDEV